LRRSDISGVGGKSDSITDGVDQTPLGKDGVCCTTTSDRDEQKAGWWRNVTGKGQFCDIYDKAIAMLA
jgi:hypothetical protein